MYWGVEYTNFWKIYLSLFLTCQIAMGLGLVISALAPNVSTATTIVPAFTTPMIAFGGLLVNTDTLPKWLGWMKYLSPIYFGNEAISHAQYDHVDSRIPQAFLVLEGFDLGYWKCIGVMIGFVFVFRIMAYFVMKS